MRALALIAGSCLAVSLAAATLAHADQCAWVEPAAADRARVLLARDTTILEYCDLCDASAGRSEIVVHDVRVQPTQDGLVEVLINGSNVDLASYAYLKRPNGDYVNLADVVGCHREGGPSELAGTPTVAGPVAAPPQQPRQVVVAVTLPMSSDLFCFGALAGGGLAILGVVLLVRRRRPALLPRATELMDRHRDRAAP